ncbi:MAG: hypothetical protein Q4F05_19420 [bacterium]|nr:hypothetical protein [bacterium]
MKKIRTTIICLVFILIATIVSGSNIFTFPSMLIRTTWEIGKIESYITVQSNERKMHIAQVNNQMVSMEFENVYRVLWSEDGYEMQSLGEHELEIGRSSKDDSTILFGNCDHKDVYLIRVEMNNGEMIETELNKDGLFGIILDGKYKDIKSIHALDKNYDSVVQINK